jgi:hypothetical protein
MGNFSVKSGRGSAREAQEHENGAYEVIDGLLDQLLTVPACILAEKDTHAVVAIRISRESFTLGAKGD